VEMVDLNIEIDNDLIAKTRDLALRYFGDDGDASLVQVLGMALMMRYVWSRSVTRGQQETGEAVSTWEFPESNTDLKNNVSMQNWLFRR
jgi:hypothetical protein